MRDLFSPRQSFSPVTLPDGDVSILHEIDMPHPYSEMLRIITEETIWRQEAVVIYGKVYDQPRLVALYGDSGKKYDYSGISLHPMPWTQTLLEVKRIVEDCTENKFNAVFLNLYRNQNDSMGFHSDDERELGKNPTIASLTFGATRTFILKHKFRKDLPSIKIPLPEGSLLLMKGITQHNWKHGINKQTKICGPRLNLTFRTIYK